MHICYCIILKMIFIILLQYNFLCNHEYFLLCIRKYYSEKGCVGLTRCRRHKNWSPVKSMYISGFFLQYGVAAVLKKSSVFVFHLFREALTRHQGERGTTWGTLRGSDMFRPQLSIYKMGWPSPSTGGALFSFLTGWEVGRAVRAPGARI